MGEDHPSYYNPDYDPDRLSQPPADEKLTAAPGEMVILPLDLLLEMCHRPLMALGQILHLLRDEAFYKALAVLEITDYGQVVAVARAMLLDHRQNLAPSDQRIYQVVDALSDIHNAFHAAVNRIHPYPHRIVRYRRKIGNSALVVEILP